MSFRKRQMLEKVVMEGQVSFQFERCHKRKAPRQSGEVHITFLYLQIVQFNWETDFEGQSSDRCSLKTRQWIMKGIIHHHE